MPTKEEQKRMGENLEKILDESFEKLTEIWPKIKEDDPLTLNYEENWEEWSMEAAKYNSALSRASNYLPNKCAKHIGINL